MPFNLLPVVCILYHCPHDISYCVSAFKGHELTVGLANELAELRKNQAQAQQTQEPDRPRTHPSTPSEFQRLKHERDVKAAERAKLYHIQMAAQKQVSAQGRVWSGC